MKLGSMYIVHTTEDILINCRSCIYFFKIDEVMKKYRRFRYYSLFKKNILTSIVLILAILVCTYKIFSRSEQKCLKSSGGAEN